MRVGILSFGQSKIDTIYRHVSGTIAARWCKEGTHERISKKVIRELALDVTPSSDPARHALPTLDVVEVPKINPPGPQTSLILSYPTASQSSYAKRDFKALWGCNQQEWQRRIGASETT